MRDKVGKMIGHGRDIAGDQNPSGGCGDPQNFRSGSRVGDDTLSTPEINGGFAPTQCPPNFRIEVGIGLEGNLQSG